MNDQPQHIPIAKPWIDDAEIAAVTEVLRSGWVTQGPQVSAFEKEFAAWVDAPYACAVSSCTTALHLALKAVGVSSGDEVITVSHSFIATANSILYCGAVPVFIDIDSSTYNMDPSLIAAAVGPKTRAILCVHQMGMPCDLTRIVATSRRLGLPLIEDAACAAGSSIYWMNEWQRIGRPHGDVACFSFHPRKMLVTGDGGMLTTASPDYDRKFRLWRQHGMSVNDAKRHASDQVVIESYECLGYNYRMTDMQAAMGRIQLKKMDDMVKRRREQVQRYRMLLENQPDITLPVEPEWAQSNWQSYCLCLKPPRSSLQIMQYLLERGISTRPGIMCSHREPALMAHSWRCAHAHPPADGLANSRADLARSEYARDYGLILPLHHHLTALEQERVAVESEVLPQTQICPGRYFQI